MWQEAVDGEISVDRFRALVAGMPTDNALARARYGDWAGEQETLLFQVESRLRDVVAAVANQWRDKGDEFIPDYLTPPLPADGEPLMSDDAEEDVAEDEAVGYDSIVSRWGDN